jgi:hypothetical protein
MHYLSVDKTGSISPPKTRPPIHTDIFRFRMDRAFFFLFERRMNKSFAKKKKEKNGQIDSE